MRYGENKIIRDVSLLAKSNYDVLVIGGGIHGASVFWEAALRGLSVALVEQNDFASGAAAQSFKVIYSGLRSLPQTDFKRMRTMTHERTILMRIAPHLVHPMPVIIPTYGGGLHGKTALGLAMQLDNLVNFDRNRSVDVQKITPNGRVLSKAESLELLGALPQAGLKGAVLFHDAQVYSAERLALAFLKSAAQIGGDLANYAQVIDLLCDERRVCGVKVLDRLSGQYFEIRARLIVNTASGWTTHLQQARQSQDETTPARFVTTTNIITRPIFDDFAVGFRIGETGFFITPWHGHALIGTHYAPSEADAQAALDDFLKQINRLYPPAALTRSDIRLVQRGRSPVQDKSKPAVLDHRQDGAEGVLSITDTQYMTARYTAVNILDQVFRLWGLQPAVSASETVPLRGGEMQSFSEYLNREMAANSWKLSEPLLKSLIYNYGSEYPNVLEYLPVKPWSANTVQERKAVLTAQIHHAVYKEMALKLGDFVFRRTELAIARQPDAEILEFCARTMGKVLDWEDHQIQRELDEVNQELRFMH